MSFYHTCAQWGAWRYESPTNTLVHEPTQYDVPLRGLHNDTDVAQRLILMMEKRWCSPSDLDALATALSVLIGARNEVAA